MRRFSGRNVFNLVELVVLVVVLVGSSCCKSQECNNSSPCAFTGGKSFQEPTQIELNGTLEALHSIIQIEWLTTRRSTFNGTLAGPTIRASNVSDTIQLTLVNNLKGSECASDSRNCIHLNTFGTPIMSQSTTPINISQSVNPQNTHKQEIQLRLSLVDNCKLLGGSHIYRSAPHGSSAEQADSGLSSMLIIEDCLMPNVSCPQHCEHDIQLLFQSTMQYSLNYSSRSPLGNLDGEAELLAWLQNPANSINYFTTNGLLWPRLDIETGQLKRFRLANAGANNTLALTLSDPSRACHVVEIAFDGRYLPDSRPVAETGTLLFPGSTAEWLVVCNQPGIYNVTSRAPVNDTLNVFDGTLLIVNVTGKVNNATRPELSEGCPDDYAGLNRQYFAAEIGPPGVVNREEFSGYSTPRYKADYNKVQEWYLLNTDRFRSHVVYFMRFSVQVLAYNEYKGPVSIVDEQKDWTFVQRDNTRNVCCRNVVSQPVNVPCQMLEDAQQPLVPTQHIAINDARSVIAVPPLGNITVLFLPFDAINSEIEVGDSVLTERDAGAMLVYAIAYNTEDPFLAESLPGDCMGDRPSAFIFNAATDPCLELEPQQLSCYDDSPPTSTETSSTASNFETSTTPNSVTTVTTAITTTTTTTPTVPSTPIPPNVAVIASTTLVATLGFVAAVALCKYKNILCFRTDSTQSGAKNCSGDVTQIENELGDNGDAIATRESLPRILPDIVSELRNLSSALNKRVLPPIARGQTLKRRNSSVS